MLFAAFFRLSGFALGTSSTKSPAENRSAGKRILEKYAFFPGKSLNSKSNMLRFRRTTSGWLNANY
jgi:hypothetical protein